MPYGLGRGKMNGIQGSKAEADGEPGGAPNDGLLGLNHRNCSPVPLEGILGCGWICWARQGDGAVHFGEPDY